VVAHSRLLPSPGIVAGDLALAQRHEHVPDEGQDRQAGEQGTHGGHEVEGHPPVDAAVVSNPPRYAAQAEEELREEGEVEPDEEALHRPRDLPPAHKPPPINAPACLK
jgi:hypothetical protein